jgi:hypothetical protein
LAFIVLVTHLYIIQLHYLWFMHPWPIIFRLFSLLYHWKWLSFIIQLVGPVNLYLWQLLNCLEPILILCVHLISITIIHFCVATFQVSHVVKPVLFVVNRIARQVLLKEVVLANRIIVCIHFIFLERHVLCWITFAELGHVVQKMLRVIVFDIWEIIVSLVVISFYHACTVRVVVFINIKLRFIVNNRQAAFSF